MPYIDDVQELRDDVMSLFIKKLNNSNEFKFGEKYEEFFNDFYFEYKNKIIIFYFLIRETEYDFHYINQSNSNVMTKDYRFPKKAGKYYTKENKEFMKLEKIKNKIVLIKDKKVLAVFYGKNIKIEKLKKDKNNYYEKRYFDTIKMNFLDSEIEKWNINLSR